MPIPRDPGSSGSWDVDEPLTAQLRKKALNVRGYRLRAYVRKVAVDPCNDLIHLTARRRQQTPNPEADRIEAEVHLGFRGKENRAFLHFSENDG